jgi:adenylate cyclase class IV
MEVRLNREIKAFCPDFIPIRRVLRDLEAAFIEVKDQVDFFYHLPLNTDAAGTRRLKLRLEEEKAELIYYYDRQERGARTSQFQLWEVTVAPLKEILDAALGVRVTVHKQREVWRKDNVVFNLDTVDDVGQVFEVEAQTLDQWDPDRQVQEYRRLFGPHLGQDIDGSNEDLVMNIPGSSF